MAQMRAWHLEWILRSYSRHYNGHRLHQGISQEIPLPTSPCSLMAATPGHDLQSHPRHIRRHDRLGGLVHEYELVA